jgi:hypothetical protein
MDFTTSKAVLAVIRQESDRRNALERDPNWAYEQWHADNAFTNELCLILLVALRHQLERELVKLAALAGHGGVDLSRAQYQQRTDELRPLRKDGSRVTDWTKVYSALGITSGNRPSPIETLRLLANAYKHDPNAQPDQLLIAHLGLTTAINYAELPESDALREGLAVNVGLARDADYISMAERLIDYVQTFLDDLKKCVLLSRVRWGPVSLLPEDMYH